MIFKTYTYSKLCRRIYVSYLKNSYFISTDTNFEIIIKPIKSILISDIDECASFPCVNNGTCEDHMDGYICLCEAGYTGVNCETGNCN